MPIARTSWSGGYMSGFKKLDQQENSKDNNRKFVQIERKRTKIFFSLGNDIEQERRVKVCISLIDGALLCHLVLFVNRMRP